MHDLCLISASTHGRHAPRPTQELDQPPTLKARRRNAVQGRRLALQVNMLERNQAAKEAERAREVRHLREELRQMRVPLTRQKIQGLLSPRHHGHTLPNVGHGHGGHDQDHNLVADHHMPHYATALDHQYHQSHHQSHHNNLQLIHQREDAHHIRNDEIHVEGLPKIFHHEGLHHLRHHRVDILPTDVDQTAENGNVQVGQELNADDKKEDDEEGKEHKEDKEDGENKEDKENKENDENDENKETEMLIAKKEEDVDQDLPPTKPKESVEKEKIVPKPEDEEEEEQYLPLGLPFRRGSLPKVLQSLNRSPHPFSSRSPRGLANNMATGASGTLQTNRTSTIPPRQAGGDTGKNSLPALRIYGKGAEQDTAKQSGSVITTYRSGGTTHRSHNERRSLETQAAGTGHIATTKQAGHANKEHQTSGVSQFEKSPRLQKGNTNPPPPKKSNHEPPASDATTHTTGTQGLQEPSISGTNRTCPLAGIAYHTCRHFPCVQPSTYHSLGFHPDTSTHPWPAWAHINASRPHHRLDSGRIQYAQAGGRETPADVPFYARKRGFGKKEHVRLEIMARRKEVHRQERPPSWNTNYGEPTPYKRLKYPVASLEPRH